MWYDGSPKILSPEYYHLNPSLPKSLNITK
uniref:Uncharacterized protein n=1 Tax=Arundo donax TaxID=35708 RepID=A0A0A9BAQ0_ARUDO